MIDTSWMVYDYPEPPPEKPMPYCARCCEALTEGYYITDSGEEICEDCFEEEVQAMELDNIADLLGYEKRWLDCNDF